MGLLDRIRSLKRGGGGGGGGSGISGKNAMRVLYVIGFILYIAGIVSITYYPSLSHPTYISENALLPGSANIAFEYKEVYQVVEESIPFDKYIQSIVPSNSPITSDMREKASQWIYDRLTNGLGIETYHHKFNIKVNGTDQIGHNIYAVVRAPKSDGTESLLLSTKFNCEYYNINGEQITSIGLVLTIVKHIQERGRQWLAKDIILVITDGYFEGHGMRQWLSDYHSNALAKQEFPRAGQIQAAINIEVNRNYDDKFYILAEGSNGQLPNLDLINTIAKLTKSEAINQESISLSPKEWPDITRYLDPSMNTLVTFMMNQAIGVPTGDHGLFNRYHIDAVTISVPGGEHSLHWVTFKNIKSIIGTLRSLNNLVEHLHQSFYYYLLPSPIRYVSIGEYMISLGLIVAPLVIRVLLLLFSLSSAFKRPPSYLTLTEKLREKGKELQKAGKPRDGAAFQLGVIQSIMSTIPVDAPKDILYSASVVVFTQLVGVAIFSIPLTFSSYNQDLLDYVSKLDTLTGNILYFSILSIIYLIVFFIFFPLLNIYFYQHMNGFIARGRGGTEEKNGTSVSRFQGGSSILVFSSLPVLLFITTMSLLNFSFCTFAGILVIPMCILPKQSGSRTARIIQTILLIVLSPPVLLCAFANLYLHRSVFSLIIEIIQHYQLYSTLAYPFFTLILIPLNLQLLRIVSTPRHLIALAYKTK